MLNYKGAFFKFSKIIRENDNMKKIAVLGSINMDLVTETSIHPKQGETVLGDHFFTSPGGKGANQAVAAARLGGLVTMFGAVGNDSNGSELISILKRENICTDFILTKEAVPTGVATIEISNNDNRIIVVPGANNLVTKDYIDQVIDEIEKNDIIVLQLEIPLETVEYIVAKLKDKNKTIILNTAPATKLSDELIQSVTYITPNEHEYKLILNTEDEMESVLPNYPKHMIITCGGEGVKYFDEEVITVPSILVDVVDTTGAGDTFTGAFATALSNDYTLLEAISFANCAGGLATTKKGAQGGMPTMEEMNAKMNN